MEAGAIGMHTATDLGFDDVEYTMTSSEHQPIY